MLRVRLDPLGPAAGRRGARLELIKSRGGSREPIELEWPLAAA
jgi:hypothetical protein